MWLIPGSGEARLVFSRWQGQVKALRLLPSPAATSLTSDHHAATRPLVAVCDSAGPGPAFCSVAFESLLTGEQVHSIKFNSEVADLSVSRRVVCVAFRERVALFDARTLRERLTLSCYPSPGVHR